jgi:hypothetical protein
MVTPHVGVGVGLDQWWRDPADSEATNTGTLIVHYYPSVRPGAFAELGAGLSRAEVRLDRGGVAGGRGLGLMAAVGYEVRVLHLEPADGPADVILTPRVLRVQLDWRPQVPGRQRSLCHGMATPSALRGARDRLVVSLRERDFGKGPRL